VRRVTVTPQPFEAEVDHVYHPILTTRAAIQTKQGVSEFNRVTVGDDTATHTMTIRYTVIPFDIRDRVRDALGTLYKILHTENVDHSRRYMKIHCMQIGGPDRKTIT
jgi:Phage head-tail joining protein